MNKKAIAISVNFLVILIVSIVLFSLGMTLFYTVFDRSTTYEKTLSDQTRSRIESVLSQGKMIAIPDIQKEIERGQTNSFGIGVTNELNEAKDFTLDVELVKFVKEDGTLGTLVGTGWQIQKNNFGTIEKNQYKANLIMISVPDDAESGTYIFDVEVKYHNGTEYVRYTESLNKIYVVVA